MIERDKISETVDRRVDEADIRDDLIEKEEVVKEVEETLEVSDRRGFIKFSGIGLSVLGLSSVVSGAWGNFLASSQGTSDIDADTVDGKESSQLEKLKTVKGVTGSSKIKVANGRIYATSVGQAGHNRYSITSTTVQAKGGTATKIDFTVHANQVSNTGVIRIYSTGGLVTQTGWANLSNASETSSKTATFSASNFDSVKIFTTGTNSFNVYWTLYGNGLYQEVSFE